MRIIGISGLARSGKDLFTTVAQNLLKEKNISNERFALAHELKSDLKDLIYSKTGIDVFTENTHEKNIIRPLLVAYGDLMRKTSEGKYWTNKLENKIKESKADVVFVTDIRYDVYPQDEVYWIKQKMRGYLYHITKYKYSEAPSKRRITTAKPVKIYNAAPNDHEMLNDPKLKSSAHYKFEWEEIETNDLVNDHYIVECVEKALNNFNLLS